MYLGLGNSHFRMTKPYTAAPVITHIIRTMWLTSPRRNQFSLPEVPTIHIPPHHVVLHHLLPSQVASLPADQLRTPAHFLFRPHERARGLTQILTELGTHLAFVDPDFNLDIFCLIGHDAPGVSPSTGRSHMCISALLTFVLKIVSLRSEDLNLPVCCRWYWRFSFTPSVFVSLSILASSR